MVINSLMIWLIPFLKCSILFILLKRTKKYLSLSSVLTFCRMLLLWFVTNWLFSNKVIANIKFFFSLFCSQNEWFHHSLSRKRNKVAISATRKEFRSLIRPGERLVSIHLFLGWENVFPGLGCLHLKSVTTDGKIDTNVIKLDRINGRS